MAWARIGVLALLAAGFQAAYFGSIALTSVSLATLITIGAAPVIVQAAELAAARQRPSRDKLATLALALASLGLLTCALAYALYYRGLRSAAASTAALMTLLEPLTATLLGVLLLGNRLGPAGTAGTVLLSISVIITAWPR